MTPTSIEWFTEADVAATLTLGGAAQHLQEILIAMDEKKVVSFPKLMSPDPLRSVHCLGAAENIGEFAGFKCWVNSAKGGAVAVYMLFNINEGRLLAMIEAGALGAMRTAAIALLAAKAMKPPGTSQIALIGTGRQAYAQLAAALLATGADSAKIWSPTVEKREAFAARAGKTFNADIRSMSSLKEAVSGANVIVTVTRSPDPVLYVEDVDQEDVHISAMGAIFSDRAEITPGLAAKASLVVVDDVSRATLADRELKPWLEKGGNPVSLGAFLKSSTPRPKGISVFKSWGLGISDLAMAKAVFLAKAGQASTRIDYPVPAIAAMMDSLAREFSTRSV